ncbi:hypothetical protein M9H77_18411 [Catharanthus roseus]|uniref:Uncharacterized protein n=1 Tax=Catharanthus roseus TaxID=4058 RepID=A0ACC0B7P8_CATRO|nr:hypothetical protein M9H77_18411 [Catharanthus roseus]
MDEFPDCACVPMLNRLRRELGRVISHYPDRNHNGITVTFILKVSFMTFSTLLCSYLKLFEADGLYTLYYERFFCITLPVQKFESHRIIITAANAAAGLVVILFTMAQLPDTTRAPFPESSPLRLDMYTNVFTDDQPSVVAYGNW